MLREVYFSLARKGKTSFPYSRGEWKFSQLQPLARLFSYFLGYFCFTFLNCCFASLAIFMISLP
jgi:hypothetical protein